MAILEYISPGTSMLKLRRNILPATSTAVAIALLILPATVLFDMNRECVRTSSRGYDAGERLIWAEPPGLTVSRTTYLNVRRAVILAMGAPLLLMASGLSAIFSTICSNRLYLLYLAANAAAMAWLVAASRKFSGELNWITARWDWPFHIPYGSSVGGTGWKVASASILFPLFLFAFRYMREGKRLHPGASASVSPNCTRS